MVKVNENFIKVETAVDKVEAAAAGAQQRADAAHDKAVGVTWRRDGGRKGGGSGAVGSRWPGCGGGRRRPSRPRPRPTKPTGRRSPPMRRRQRRRSPPLPAWRQPARPTGRRLPPMRPPWSRTARRSRPRKPPPWPRPPPMRPIKRRKRRFRFPTRACSRAWPRWKAGLRRWPMRRFHMSRRLPYGTTPTGTNCPSMPAMTDSSCA